MTKGRFVARFAFGILSIASTIQIASAQDASTVLARLHDAARGRPIEFAMLLAHLSVPVGIEVFADERTPQRMPDFEIVAPEPFPVAELVETFNSSRQDHRAAVFEGFVVIRPSDSRATYLDGPLAVDEATVVTGARSALRRIFAPLDSTLSLSGGILSSSLVHPAESGNDAVIRLDPDQLVLSALNSVVRQSGVRGWIVATRRTAEKPASVRITWVGLLHSRGGSSGFEISSRS